MYVLEEYEAASGQKINKEKSSFYMHEGAQADEVNTVHLITEFQRHSFPFTYLGYPIFYSRRRKDFYKNSIFKVQERLSSWKGKLLSIGGRVVLISHVLKSMPIHLLSAVNPPTYVINQLHKMFARFYWSNSSNGRERHWASWDNLCLTKSEGVVENGAWNELLLRELLLDELADHILETITPYLDLSMKDKPWWKLETKGHFTVTYAWQYIRKRREESKLYKFFWVKGLPFKISFFMWGLWKAKLPLDNWFLRLGYFRTSRCWCCRNPKEEALPPVFLTSPAARYVWNYYSAHAGIRTNGKQLVQVRRPGFKGVTAYWPYLHEKLSQHIPKLRDGIGDIIYAHADTDEDATNNVAEAHAILKALRYITQMQFPPCIIDTDSLLMKRVLDEDWEPPWSIANQMDEIKTLLSKGAFQIFHVLRECNKLADHLANLTLDQQHIVQALWKGLGSMF
nr:uncharacterized protein LOC117280749 [Nicotiana tomentosiformis]